ncbi:esterase-like activity of phytase family protein [Sphingomonas sp. 35-24ZXX]|uniref:esterase-like activity of phytase family protein n=1 Tax=Sphingomonas sp. 35-24ZXX TaxID=1545915 RepID=UPI00068C0938|nr:esterase-like activity of phytase family protein [Sphingomonas sp. 35-24ZXX]
MLTRALALLSLLFFLGTGAFVADSQIPANTSQQITLRRPLDLPRLPHAIGDGELVLIGGWELDSDNSDFGGFSALHAVGQGRLLALSDAAILAGLTVTGMGLAADSFIAPLPVRKGERSTKNDQDSESLTHDPVSGRYWIGFEQRHRIRRYSPGFARAEATGKPAAMQGWPKNGGAEALVRRSDGSFVVFSESRSVRRGVTIGLIYKDDPVQRDARAEAFAYQPPQGYRITDVAALPDGRLLALHRRFNFVEGVSAKIGIIAAGSVRPRALVRPRIIATLKPPFPTDNMEGIAIDSERGRTIVWVISDDNYLNVQRTLLLKFVLNQRAASRQP